MGTRGDHLYVIGEEGCTGPVKVGRANDLGRRLREIQTCHPRTLAILHVEHGAGMIETKVHDLLRDCHLRGEWFDFGEADPAVTVADAIQRVRDGEVAGPVQLRQAGVPGEGFDLFMRCLAEQMVIDPESFTRCCQRR